MTIKINRYDDGILSLRRDSQPLAMVYPPVKSGGPNYPARVRGWNGQDGEFITEESAIAFASR
jgi:hypothetical protein